MMGNTKSWVTKNSPERLYLRCKFFHEWSAKQATLSADALPIVLWLSRILICIVG